ncbi:hypothetical protein SARC_02010 [Sphaeroforma arctica JP610]|uniref:Uncharacterized protein n=1 Tax=Sphaeroforma arctica JP610 TaxID=667725 RepID=A0A0L0G9W7_9EUKA|nr:hypothetical protein SARC_02010 [Sphaeroforma arctica JP610]KNC85827.1 hypothetical protein SARC_02010 [Sphaeroforma arctica JP610]|eukprot:XP_014159729.1 hypothetical protein SARC_02010 [Sphaeroforma arctica JP610]
MRDRSGMVNIMHDRSGMVNIMHDRSGMVNTMHDRSGMVNTMHDCSDTVTRASGTTGSLPVDGAEANNANVASQVRASIADETRSEETQDETLNEKLSLTKEGKLTIGDDVQLSPDESSAIAAAMCGWAPPVAHVPDYLKNMNDKELLSTLFKDA